MANLTLNVEKSITLRAKRYSKQHGVSVSKLVEEYLDLITTPVLVADQPPILRLLRGTLKSADTGTYRTHLINKHDPVQRSSRT
jgi:Family of unknown function (DUF6364)